MTKSPEKRLKEREDLKKAMKNFKRALLDSGLFQLIDKVVIKLNAILCKKDKLR